MAVGRVEWTAAVVAAVVLQQLAVAVVVAVAQIEWTAAVIVAVAL